MKTKTPSSSSRDQEAKYNLKKLADVLLSVAEGLTPEEVAKLEAEAKERNYREAIQEVIEKMRDEKDAA